MSTESELRRRFHDDEPGGAIDRGAIDLRAVLRRSRARRRPRVAAAAIASSLAVAGIVVPVSISVATTHTTTSVLGAGSEASAPDSAADPTRLPGQSTSGSGIKRAPAEKINLCTGAVANPAPADDGLVLTVQPVDATAGARDIPVTVTLTNTGAQRVTGSLSPFPALTFSRDGVVLWHSNGAVPSLAQDIDLAPGASTAFQASFEPVICGVEDDTRASFRTDLPDAAPGDYRLSAALDFSPDPSDAASSEAAVLVSGPTSLVTLH